jgi:OHCU decarboxylase
MPTVLTLNESSQSEFIKVVSLLFEPAPPLADALFKCRPFADYNELIQKSDEIMKTLPQSEQIQVVNAHPRIGASSSILSDASKKEQADTATGKELEQVLKRLEVLNIEYETKFGFKFLVFVNGRSRSEIVKVLETRILNDRSDELATGLKDMISIAKDRLSKLLLRTENTP